MNISWNQSLSSILFQNISNQSSSESNSKIAAAINASNATTDSVQDRKSVV